MPRRDRRRPKVPRVNLLDPTVEPTDAELEALMRDVLWEVRSKNAKLKRTQRVALDRAFGNAVDKPSSDRGIASDNPVGSDDKESQRS